MKLLSKLEWIAWSFSYALINIWLVFEFYLKPGYSNVFIVKCYNIISLIILTVAILIFFDASKWAFELNYLNSKDLFPDQIKKWKKLWNEYSSTMNAATNKTDQPADMYFNADEIIEHTKNRIPILPILKAMPATYTGLGILGTFMGFSAGLQNFNTENVDSMQNSIRSLLTGINTAFNTSIIGLLLSIFFNFCMLQPLIKKLEKESRILCDRLDKKYYASTIDQIKEIFIFKTNDEESVHPKDFFFKIVEELETQSRSLANFTTDLSDSIQNLTTSLMDAYKLQLSSIIEDKIEPILHSLLDISEKMKQQKEESAAEAIHSIVSELKESLAIFIQQMKDELTGSTMAELQKMAQNLESASGALTYIPNLISNMEQSFTTILDLGSERIGSTLNTLIENLNITAENFNKIVDSTKEQQDQLAANLEQLKQIKVDSDNTVKAISETTLKLTNASNLFIDQYAHLSESITQEEDKIKVILSSVESAIANFNKLDETLDSVFEEISSGIKEYSSTISESLTTNLSKYADSITSYSTRLAGAAESLQEAVDALSEQIDEIKKAKLIA
jgi:methyl-accepting chemotaxis protein